MAEIESIGRIDFHGVRIEVDSSLSFDEVHGRLTAMTGQAPVEEVIEAARKASSQEAFRQQVEAEFLGSSGFITFARIDHGGWISLYGIKRRMERWILGSPMISITMIQHDLSAGLFAPVEILLTEGEGGKGSNVFYVLPSSLIAGVNATPELRNAAVALDTKLNALIVNATAAAEAVAA